MTASSPGLSTPSFELRSGESWRDPWDDYRRLRDDAPVCHATTPDGYPYVVLSRFDDVVTAMRDHARFSSASGLTPGPDAMAAFADHARPIVMMDPPDHTAMRRLVARRMTPRSIAGLESAIDVFVRECLDPVAAGEEVDIVEVLAKPLPSFVVAHLLGVPVGERARFDQWTQVIVDANAEGELDQISETFMELFAWAGELVERRKRETGDDLVSDLVAVGEEQASLMWIVGFIFTMITGGNDTTTGLLSGALELLHNHPDERQRLLNDPALLPTAVEEALRLTSPVQNLARTTTADVTLHDEVIPAGTKVLLVHGSANRDEREFGSSAGVFEIDRQIDRTVALGNGAHHCLGASAARLQAQVALTQILDRFPTFTVDGARGSFGSGGFVRRRIHLPFVG